uniref:Uncharacterized protein n=1 Tax=Manihot esculenta TaxID=3983 RepID=A0A2C9UTY5_MANES
MASLSVKSTLVHLQLPLLIFLTALFCMVEEVRATQGQREFDYFKLALQWPGTYCQSTRQCCSSNACCRGSNAPTEFTIHGLWPDYNDGTWPACCRRSDFDEKEISTLLDGLQKYWPTLSCGSSSTCHGTKGSFWAHEWEKHGTCSSPVVHDEYSYFVTVLNLFFKYNVTDIFLQILKNIHLEVLSLPLRMLSTLPHHWFVQEAQSRNFICASIRISSLGTVWLAL